MSERVEKRLLEILNDPKFSPYGNAIPGLEDLGGQSEFDDQRTVSMTIAARDSSAEDRFTVSRFPESLQTDTDLLKKLADAGILAGATVSVLSGPDGGVLVHADGEEISLTLDDSVADAVIVKRS